MSVVPPPISTNTTPASFSSSVKTASEEASGSRNKPSVFSFARSTHYTPCDPPTRAGPPSRAGAGLNRWPSRSARFVRFAHYTNSRAQVQVDGEIDGREGWSSSPIIPWRPNLPMEERRDSRWPGLCMY